MAALQRRERRLLLVAAVVGAIVIGYTYVLEPLVARHEQVGTLIAARQELLTRQRRLAARDRYARERQALEAEIAQRRARLLPGDKPPVAASELQKLIKSTAQETGVEVRSERILPATDHGSYTEVPVEVTLSGPIRALVAFLHQLEAAPILLGISDLKLRTVSLTTPRDLTATVALTGYIAAAPDGEPRPGRGLTVLSRLLLLVDALLVIAILALGVRLYGVWTAPRVTAPASAPAAATAEAPPAAAPTTPPARPPLSAFAVVAEQNLFSSTRTKAGPEPAKPATPTPAAGAAAGLKPRLYGVVLGTDGGPRAFLEDPRTKKVFGYAVGDSVAESRVEQIEADRVRLRRGSEVYHVLLRDPSKPKPPAAPVPGVPGAGPPGTPTVTPQPPGAPTVRTPGPTPAPSVTPRRPVPRVPSTVLGAIPREPGRPEPPQPRPSPESAPDDNDDS